GDTLARLRAQRGSRAKPRSAKRGAVARSATLEPREHGGMLKNAGRPERGSARDQRVERPRGVRFPVQAPAPVLTPTPAPESAHGTGPRSRTRLTEPESANGTGARNRNRPTEPEPAHGTAHGA